MTKSLKWLAAVVIGSGLGSNLLIRQNIEKDDDACINLTPYRTRTGRPLSSDISDHCDDADPAARPTRRSGAPASTPGWCVRRGLVFEWVFASTLPWGCLAVAGIMLLSGAAFPNLVERADELHDWIPLPAVEASHTASVVIGLTLIAAARGLSLRLQRALWLAVTLLISGALFCLVRGLDWGTGVLFGIMATLLFVSDPASPFFRSAL